MAVVAVIATRYMPRVLAGSRGAVVAGTASADNLCVVDSECRQPGIRRMAIFADIRCLNVILVLAGRVDAVVTAYAVAGDIDVVKIRRQPARGCMAIFAVVAAGYVRRVLPGCYHAIMAGPAGANHLRVVDRIYRYPDIGIVAVFAYVSRLDMSRILAGRFNAIVTTDAIARDADMVEIGRQPTSGCVAVVTVIAAGDVV